MSSSDRTDLADRALTPSQVANQVQVSRQTVMRAIMAGDLEASQLAQGRGGWRVWPAAIDDWRDRRSNRRRPPRPLADVRPVEATSGIQERVERARSAGRGKLAYERGMGRAA